MSLARTLPADLQMIGLLVENVKNVRLISVKPKGPVLQITGANGSGKSSYVDSIEYALTGKSSFPSEVIRRGERESRIVLELGIDDKTVITVHREFYWGIPEGETEEQILSRLYIESEKGARYNAPQQMLNELWSKLALDPVSFAEQMKPREQLEVMRRLVKLDIDIEALDKETEELFVTRTGVGRDVRDLTARAEAYLIGPDWPTESVNVSKLLAEMTVAAERNRELEKQAAYRAADREKVEVIKRSVHEKQEQVRILRAEIESLVENGLKLEAELDGLADLPAAIDLAPLRDGVTAANLINDKVRQYTEFRQLQAALLVKEGEQDGLTKRIDDNRTLRDRTIASAQFPVAGLSFGKDELMFNGFPLSQASSADRYRIATAVVMAQNPQLKLIIIKNGSLLDSKSLQMFEDLARENNFRVLMEVVDESGTVGVYLEDGVVKASDETADALL